MTSRPPRRHDAPMTLPVNLPASLAWLVDEAGASPGPDRFLAELGGRLIADGLPLRSEEHTSELQSLMRISYAVFCLKKKTNYTIPILSSTLPFILIYSRHT